MAHTVAPIAPVEDASEFGPAMAKLLPQQRAWVMAFLATGHSQNATAAAKAAGYGANSATPERHLQTCQVTGYRLRHDPKIQEAIKELSKSKFKIAAHLATSELVLLLDNPDPKVKLKAIDMVLARTGLGAAQEVNVNHNHSYADMDDKAMIRRIAQLAQDQGMDPIKLLGSRGVTIDAEFEVVEAEVDTVEEHAKSGPDVVEEYSSAGLEDLL